MRSGDIDCYDAIFLSPHKFLGGPGSPGILLMSKALYQLGCSAPSTCGGGIVDFVNGFNEKVDSISFIVLYNHSPPSFTTELLSEFSIKIKCRTHYIWRT